MRGFFGLNVAVSGLFTAQRNLDVVNNNLSNVNTPGYSRQYAAQSASMPIAMLDGTGMVGTGSEVTGVYRIRDEYMDAKYIRESSAYGEWEAKFNMLSDLEAAFNEPSDSGFSVIFNEFFNSLQELAKDPSSPAVRALVRETGVTVAKYFNNLATHLEQLQRDINNIISVKVESVNSLAEQISQLNKQIFDMEVGGNIANELRVQRTLLVDKLSRIINVNAYEVKGEKLPDGTYATYFVVDIGGKSLVSHANVCKICVEQRQTSLNPEDAEKLYEVKWSDGNNLSITSGELRGYLDIRDGNEGENGSPMYRGVPYYIKKLNQFVRTFAMAFNEGYIDVDNSGTIEAGEDGAGHADGYGIDNGTGTPISGIRFFTMTGDDGKPVSSQNFINGATSIDDIVAKYSQITAKNFAISSDIMSDVNLISTSDTFGEKGNIENLNRLLQLRHNTHMFAEGAPEDFVKSIVSSLGVDAQQAKRLTNTQEAVISQIDNRRISVSGVSIDEEMINLVKHQQAYNASARMITTITEMYDKLINEVGIS